MRVVSYWKDDALGRPDLGRTLVDRFFGYVTADLLQRSDHRSVQALEADIRKLVTTWNENPKPFLWTKTAEQILGNLGRLIQRTSNRGTRPLRGMPTPSG